MLLVELLLPILGVFKVCCPVVTRKNAFFECVRIRSAARVCTIDISPGSITRSLDLYVHAHIVAEYFHNIFAHPKMCSVSVKSLEITMNKKTKTSAIERECTTNQILCEAYCIVVRLFHRSICVRSIWGQLGPSAAIRRSLSPGPRLPRSINAAVAASIPMEVVYPLSLCTTKILFSNPVDKLVASLPLFQHYWYICRLLSSGRRVAGGDSWRYKSYHRQRRQGPGAACYAEGQHAQRLHE